MADALVEKFTLGISVMFTFYFVLTRLILRPLAKKYNFSHTLTTLASTLLLYIPGIPILTIFLSDFPRHVVSGLTYGLKEYVILLLAQLAVIFILAAISLIETKLSKNLSIEDDKDMYQTVVDVFLLLLLIPFLEELIARKYLGDIAGGAPLWLYLFLSATVFSLIHWQTGRIAVPLGMFYLGFLWALVYAASRNVWLVTGFHLLNNLLLTYIPEQLKRRSGKWHALYMACLAMSGIVGIVLFIGNRASLLPSEGVHQAGAWRTIFTSRGMWILIAVSVVSFVLRKRDQAIRRVEL